jgi:ribosomal-protein-alanine N-acetyltransferase
VILRGGLPGEAPVLALIHAEAFAAADRWGADAIALMLQAAGGFGVIALDGAPPFGEEPLGFALARLAAGCVAAGRAAAAGEAEVLTLAVRPLARRRGIGRALFDAVCARARDAGAEALFLEVAEGNGAARALYAAAGAAEVGRRRRYYPDGGDALVLKQSLLG